MTDLLDALEARSGIVCAVGAGGKKTTLYRLAAAHPGRVAITSTVFIAPFPGEFADTTIIADPEFLAECVADSTDVSRVAFACPSDKPQRHGGVPPDRVREFHERGQFDLTLVKADGARMRGIKAPKPGEPNLPPSPDVVLYLVSASVFGQPLDESIAHRVDYLEAVMDTSRGSTIDPEHIARLLTADTGASQGIGPDTRLIPVINQVDDEKRREYAYEAARMALSRGGHFDRVVLTSMHASSPVVDVVS